MGSTGAVPQSPCGAHRGWGRGGAASHPTRSLARSPARPPARLGPTLHRAIVPIGACYAGTLWVGNAAYLYLSVSFIQMLKVG